MDNRVLPNLFEPDWDEQRADAPLRGQTMQVGRPAGCTDLGATLYEIDPENHGSPYHLHHANEELIIVLAGCPSVRTPQGIVGLVAGDVLACAAGRSGAHQIQNLTAQRVRVLAVSTMRYPEVAELPDSDKVLVLTAGPATDQRLVAAFPKRSAVDRLTGELEESISDGAERRPLGPGSNSLMRLLLISGSLREGSTNTAALRTVRTLSPTDVVSTLYEGMGDLPHFNPDADREGAPVHPAVARLREHVSAADAVIICTPERSPDR